MHLLLLALLLPKPHWIHVKDGVTAHTRYVNGYGNVLGEYYKVEPGRFQAQCYAGNPVVTSSEDAAKAFVLRCEVW